MNPSKYPSSNINLCIIGCVSAGKSILLNALFCDDISQSKIKRTTMKPIIFIEKKHEIDIDYKSISETITKSNQEIIKLTEETTTDLNLTLYNELVFDVAKIDINITDNMLTIYDIPGLNDAKTKSIYYNYLENNFLNFNIIITFKCMY